MKCEKCGNQQFRKIEDEKFLTATYICENGHITEVVSSKAKTAVAGGIFATVAGILVWVLTGKPPQE